MKLADLRKKLRRRLRAHGRSECRDISATDQWDKFVENMHEQLIECCKTGKAARLMIGIDERNITIDIYESSRDVENFNKMIQNAANAPPWDIKKK